MYIALKVLLYGLGIFFLYKGIENRSRTRITGGAALIICTFLFFWFLDFWGEKLWFPGDQ